MEVEVFPMPKKGKGWWRVEVLIFVVHRDTKKGGWLRYFSERWSADEKPPSDRTVAKLARMNLHRAMCHEVDECIYVNGKRPYDPHKRRRKKRRS